MVVKYLPVADAVSLKVAENLALFRRWCFATYGGVAIAFHALDADGSGSLSEEEFVAVIQNSSFKGGIRTCKRYLEISGDILNLYLLISIVPPGWPRFGSSGWHRMALMVFDGTSWQYVAETMVSVPSF